MTRKFKRVPFDPDHFREQLANASQEILQDMSTALALREEVIQKHIGLIQLLEDDTLSKPLNWRVSFLRYSIVHMYPLTVTVIPSLGFYSS